MFDENLVVEKAFRGIDGNHLNNETINFAEKLTKEYADIAGENIDYITTAAKHDGHVYNEDGEIIAYNSGDAIYLSSRGSVDGELTLCNKYMGGTLFFKNSGVALNISTNDLDSKFKKKEIRYFNSDTVKLAEALHEQTKWNNTPFLHSTVGSEYYFVCGDVIKPDEKFSYRSTEEFLKKLKEAAQLAKGEDVKHM